MKAELLKTRLIAQIVAICGSSLMLWLVFTAPVLAAEEEDKGNFLVQPKGGLMVWTLISFLITLWVLKRFFFPMIQKFLDERRRAIQETVDAAERTRKEAEELLEEYRQRLTEAREQADEILSRARKAGDSSKDEAIAQAKEKQDEMLARTRREIETETRLALERIRKEVADLTVIATEKITRKTLDDADHKRLVEEALQEVDFSKIGNGSGSS